MVPRTEDERSRTPVFQSPIQSTAVWHCLGGSERAVSWATYYWPRWEESSRAEQCCVHASCYLDTNAADKSLHFHADNCTGQNKNKTNKYQQVQIPNPYWSRQQRENQQHQRVQITEFLPLQAMTMAGGCVVEQ